MEINRVIKKYKEATINQGLYLEDGQSKKADKEMIKMKNFHEILKKEKEIELLASWLNDPNKYVQLESAFCLRELVEYKKVAEEKVKKLSDEEGGFYSATAYLLLDQWGNNY